MALYKDETFWASVFEALGSGVPLNRIASSYDVAYTKLVKKIKADPNLNEQYELARKTAAMAEEDKIATVSQMLHERIEMNGVEDFDPHLAKILLDYVKWRTSMLDPDRYSEKRQVSVQHSVSQQYVQTLRDLAKAERKVIDVTPREMSGEQEVDGKN